MTTDPFHQLLPVSALAAGHVSLACEATIQMAIEARKIFAYFKIGDSRCSLIDSHVSCTRVSNGD